MSLKLGSNDTAILAGSSVVKQMLLGSSPKFAAPVLDHVPGAAAAYSLRRLSNAYTGPVVKVRRSSDSTAADFTAAEVVDGTLTAWVGAGDGFVHTWYDQSGNARNATQATDGYQPKLVSSGSLVTEGGKAALYFNDDMLSTPDIALSEASFLIVANSERPTASYAGSSNWLGYSGSAGQYANISASTDTVLAAYAGVITAPVADSASMNLVSFTGSASGGKIYGNAAAGQTNASPASFRVDKIGSYAHYVGGPYAAIGRIQELIIYPSDVSASRELAEGEIAWHYGLQAKLPYDHAYAPQALGGSSQTVPTDSDAIAYLEAVAAADGAAVERSVAIAIDDFVKGLKADGLWSAIGSACVLAGARTVAGALVPLKGAAPTGYNWVASDYSRSLGLKGDGSTKYIDSNYTVPSSHQDDTHAAAYASGLTSTNTMLLSGWQPTGCVQMFPKDTQLVGIVNSLTYSYRTYAASSEGFFGMARNSSAIQQMRAGGGTYSGSVASTDTPDVPVYVLARNFNGTTDQYSSARLSFYSIGASLDLALLDARVSSLMSALGAAL